MQIEPLLPSCRQIIYSERSLGRTLIASPNSALWPGMAYLLEGFEEALVGVGTRRG